MCFAGIGIAATADCLAARRKWIRQGAQTACRYLFWNLSFLICVACIVLRCWLTCIWRWTTSQSFRQDYIEGEGGRLSLLSSEKLVRVGRLGVSKVRDVQSWQSKKCNLKKKNSTTLRRFVPNWPNYHFQLAKFKIWPLLSPPQEKREKHHFAVAPRLGCADS